MAEAIETFPNEDIFVTEIDGIEDLSHGVVRIRPGRSEAASPPTTETCSLAERVWGRRLRPAPFSFMRFLYRGFPPRLAFLWPPAPYRRKQF